MSAYNESTRFEELDSLRGIAALTVVLYHGSALLGIGLITRVLQVTPLHFLISAQQAVMLFFLLSGFVLSLPFVRGSQVRYSHFMIKRFCRLYLPYIVALAFALIMRVSFSQHPVEQILWKDPITVNLILRHILMVDQVNQFVLDPVVWSLVHEMRISILLPFIMVVILRYRSRISLLLGIALSCLSLPLAYLIAHFGVISDPFTNYYSTLNYIFIFIVGALLAKHLKTLTFRYNTLPRLFRCTVLVLAFLMYSYADDTHISSVFRTVFSVFVGTKSPYLTDMFQPLFISWISTVSGAVFIIVALSGGAVQRILRTRVLIFLGKISFSVYLYHIVVMLTLISIVSGKLPTWCVWIGSLGITGGVAIISYHFVEVPGIRLGRYLTRPKKDVTSGTIVANQSRA